MVAAAPVALANTEPTIAWGTYHGGASSGYLFGLGALPDGSVCVLGGPTEFRDARISRFDAAGQLLWSFLYGGQGGWGRALTVVPGQSDFYVTGMTEADEGIATAGTHQTARSCFGHGAECGHEGFIARFDAAGNRVWGTYFGGPFHDSVDAAAADASGALYVCGETASLEGIATAGSHQSTWIDPGAFVASFEANGVLRWATYYAGSCDSIAVDAAGDAVYIAGSVSETANLATPGAHQEQPGGAFDAHLARFTGTGERVWATYYGGSDDDLGQKIRVDATGAVYVLGETHSSDAIATSGAFQDRPGGQQDLFLARFTADGERVWATYFGGADEERASSLAIGDEGGLYLAASTTSKGLATQDAPRPHPAGDFDAMVARFDGDGALRWATYYGGSGSDIAWVVDTGPGSSVYLGGYTGSTSGIATPGAYQDVSQSGQDAFIVKFLQDS
ncbi:hypothetical protein [Nannocystis radixulma]|uniref:Beta-propeller repeat-containing protein n=1 Tax=Nannocystis radixulma TaxID=2995305 RepID=A0ABT5BKI6_9BACT|nr:hypothetical protein [Nannocystis radixulma]MDC0674208.1 hypothetical protein [Nannocystis radixulma]